MKKSIFFTLLFVIGNGFLLAEEAKCWAKSQYGKGAQYACFYERYRTGGYSPSLCSNAGGFWGTKDEAVNNWSIGDWKISECRK